MPEPLTTYRLEWRNCYLQFYSEFNNLYGDVLAAKAQCEAESWAGLALAFGNMSVHLLNIRSWFMGETRSIRNVMTDAIGYIDDNIGDGAEVTMDSILTAMLGAEFDELQKFVGLVDAYRVALWNAPFNADFYAALARGFATWPQY